MDNSPNTMEEIQMQESERKAYVSALTVIVCMALAGILLLYKIWVH